MTETVWPTKPKIFTIWPLTEKNLLTPGLGNDFSPAGRYSDAQVRKKWLDCSGIFSKNISLSKMFILLLFQKHEIARR